MAKLFEFESQETKKCVKCKETKTVPSFNFVKESGGGYDDTCRTCRNLESQSKKSARDIELQEKKDKCARALENMALKNELAEVWDFL